MVSMTLKTGQCNRQRTSSVNDASEMRYAFLIDARDRPTLKPL